MAFTPDGQRLASASPDKRVRLWDVRGEKELLSLQGHTASVNTVAFAPDGNTLASASADGTMKLWNTQDGSVIATFTSGTDKHPSCLVAICVRRAAVNNYLILIRTIFAVFPSTVSITSTSPRPIKLRGIRRLA